MSEFSQNKKVHDIIIVGAGPAGMAATVYCARKKLDVLLITKNIGGQVLWTSGIENYMGFQYITGMELSDKFYKQIEENPVSILNASDVILIKKENNIFYVNCKDDYAAKSVIIATGKTPRLLGIKGEKELTGRGISYCSICDAPLFAGKTVVVVGGGNSALTTVLELLAFAQKIIVVNVLPTLQADKVLVDKALKSGKVELMLESQLTEIIGTSTVEAVIIQNNKSNTKCSIDAGGVFVQTGLIPATDIFNGFVELNEKKEIKIDSNCRTSMDGVFACGDVTDIFYKQIIIACAEGAKAALSAHNYLIKNN